MKCKCGGVSRQLNNNEGHRQYKCGGCLNIFFTKEMYESDLKSYAYRMLIDILNVDRIKEARRVLKAKGYLK